MDNGVDHLFPSAYQYHQYRTDYPPHDQINNDDPIDDEPLYVNAKQYFRILKRRVARARLEEVHRLSRQRKPYLHESRHRHAMRRPRGPGGRFLTAEEIAAQKAAPAQDSGPSSAPIVQNDIDEMEEEDDDLNVPISPPIGDPFIHSPDIMDMSYRPLDHHMSLQMAPSPSLPQTVPKQAPPAPAHNIYTHHHSHNKGTTNSAPITLSSPYPATVQMHHVPHPHAHARHHHSNLNYANSLYGTHSPVPSSNAEMQRRTEEMIQFGAGSAV